MSTTTNARFLLMVQALDGNISIGFSVNAGINISRVDTPRACQQSAWEGGWVCPCLPLPWLGFSVTSAGIRW